MKENRNGHAQKASSGDSGGQTGNKEKRGGRDEYALTLQTPGNPIRAKLFVMFENNKAHGEFLWESLRIPFFAPLDEQKRFSCSGVLGSFGIPYTIWLSVKDGGNVLQGRLRTPLGEFPVYGRRVREASFR